jgi:hypothetical protein
MGFGNAANPNPSMGVPGANPFIQGPTARPAANKVDPINPVGGGGFVTSEGSTTPTANPWGQSQSQQNWTEKYLQETYGGGMGSLVYQYLMSNGGMNTPATQQMIGAQTNAMQQQTQLGVNSAVSTLGAMGISGSSPGLQDTVAGIENQAIAKENALSAEEFYNMWNASQNREMGMIQFAAEGTGKTLANKMNWMDYLNEGLNVAADVVTLGAKGMPSGQKTGSGGGAYNNPDATSYGSDPGSGPSYGVGDSG